MSDANETPKINLSSLTRTAIEGGKSALESATSASKAGARLAVGTLFAGANVLLDLGVRVARGLPIESNGEVRLESPEGEISAVAIGRGRDARSAAPIGWYLADEPPAQAATPAASTEGDRAESDVRMASALRAVTRPVYAFDLDGGVGVANIGRCVLGADAAALSQSYPLRAYVPPLGPEMLGDASLRSEYGLKYAYLGGAMANGIGSCEVVEAMSQAGMLAFFGSAGLSIEHVDVAITRLQKTLGDSPFGMNLIHSPGEPLLEAGVVDLYLRRDVRLVDASAYLDLTLPLVRYRVSGIHRGPGGGIVCPNKVIGKISRVEVAKKMFSPPPEAMLRQLVELGDITAAQAELARHIPVAQDLTVEADSGGHTDNRPAITLFPGIAALRDEMQKEHGYEMPLRLGLAGGIATPGSVAAAFAMGAAYVMTGSINQACIEAGTSQLVREMLAQAGQADVTMAPAADMFEMGVKVQVLKWGTMFPVRARKLYDLYREYASLEALPAPTRTMLERDYLRCTIEEAWQATKRHFELRDPAQIERAEKDPKHKMALVFRSYLGQSSNWANSGDASRKLDFQIWCGPAMGAFNEWTRGTFMEKPENRQVATAAMNLLVGACVLMRANALRVQGIPVSAASADFKPVPAEEIGKLLAEVAV
ncbi:MAG TPA: PfaD family polyunsaturated fatty acid/polyketide biosynthesis protein [Phycisphaerae bacterium]|nr:PfaD family polyunsaturated fatty acid/polyketide biosynthesis protein [Phycisphaerae bacterium]